jgi:CdiI N-terminal domain
LTNFGIAFTGFDEEDPLVVNGELKLGDDREYFQSILGFWGVDDYLQSWTEGLQRLLAGASISCLATSVIDPSNANFVEVWPLYREQSDVYVQNRLLFLDQLSHEFDPSEPWNSVDPRSVVNEDGQRISEWRVNLSDVREFLESDGKVL